MSKLIVDIDSILSFLYIQVDNYGPHIQSFTYGEIRKRQTEVVNDHNGEKTIVFVIYFSLPRIK